MIHITPRISRLAVSIVKPASIQVNVFKTTSSSSCSRVSNHFCSGARSEFPKLKKPLRPQITLTQQNKRHCSHRRTMCKANADIVGGSMDVEKGREVLPTNVKPVHYNLTLEPDFEKFSYEGTVIIEYVQSGKIWILKLPQLSNHS